MYRHLLFCSDEFQNVNKIVLDWNSHRSPKLLVRIWCCLYTWLRTDAVYYKTLYGNLLYPWIFFRNKTCKTILFHLLVYCLLLLLHVESWAVSSIIERVIGSGRWGEVEEIEGRKPSWFMGETHHTLSAIKSSHTLRLVQELASNRPDASSDRQTDQKTIHSPNTGEKAMTFQSFSTAIFPSWPAMTPMLSDFRVMSQSETDRNDTAINNERKLTFSFLNLRNCRVRPDIATNWAEQL